jgi:ATP-dependent Clp protease protease subunit
MPIGVPRIIYCWGEELPAQWTDIYNFIFRRRMIFLMQYLDDELCNQICGLLINIHMEDRSKELEKKESEKSNVFKSSTKVSTNKTNNNRSDTLKSQQSTNTQKSIQDLLISEEDLAIDENYKLEQYTLQKITLDWLNWTANFFDYANEPYLFYLTEILAKDFIADNGNLLYKVSEISNIKLKTNTIKQEKLDLLESSSTSNHTPENSINSELASLIFNKKNDEDEDLINENLTAGYEELKQNSEMSKFMGIFKAMINSSMLSSRLQNRFWTDQIFEYWTSWNGSLQWKSVDLLKQNNVETSENSSLKQPSMAITPFVPYGTDVTAPSGYNSILILEKLNQHENVYSPFRFLANFASNDYKFKALKSIIEQQTYDTKKELTSISDYKFSNSIFSKSSLHELSSNKKKQTSFFSKKIDLVETQSENLKEKLFQQLKLIEQNEIKQRALVPVVPSFRKEKEMVRTPLFPSFAPQQKEDRSGRKEAFKAPIGTDALSRDILKELAQKYYGLNKQTHKTLWESTKKGLGQRILKNQYRQDKIKLTNDPHTVKDWVEEKSKSNSSDQQLISSNISRFKIKNAKNYLNLNYFSSVVKNSSLTSDQTQSLTNSKVSSNKKINNLNSYRKQSERTFSYRKQTERTLQEEELKKVFVIINSFGGSVGNGITVHDALQFIKAGSLTLALGVAASAASLALAGGTIGERYITEGCHTMIHQPEGSINGQASDILIDSNEIMKIRLDVAEIYSLSTYRPRHKILRDLDRDFYLTATETVYYGLADEIATNEVMQEIIEMTSKVWDYHESQQQRLLESRESATFGLDTLTQN